MFFYVYILQSEYDGSFYKGYSLDPLERLKQHNNGETASTKKKSPWKLVYVERWNNKRDALIREKNLKKADRSRIIALIASSKNIVEKILSDDDND